jgi:hydroxymethylbilane synthase
MAKKTQLRLGTRASDLALWQADWVTAELAARGFEIERVLITTQGDATQIGPIGAIGGQGVFTKEIQRALLENRIDLAVHSLKDLPTEPVEGLTLAAVPERENVGDVLVSPQAYTLDELPQAAIVGTGSLRRRTQLLHVRPDLKIEDIRGNVDTRLKKLDDGQYDAIVLAEAGLRRLEFTDRITHVLDRAIMLPAVGQGALGIEARADDAETLEALLPLQDVTSRAAVTAERRLLHSLRGGCLAPIGAWGRMQDDRLTLSAVVLSHDGQQKLTAETSGSLDNAESLGQSVADDLIGQGATELIQSARESNS